MGFVFDFFKYSYKDFLEMLYIRKVFYRDRRFHAIDRTLLKKYILKSPYRISKKYLKKRNDKNIYSYGETPLKTFDFLAKKIKIKPYHRFLDLGCGRGRGLLFLAHFYKCEVIGIERIPQFVKLARFVAQKFQIPKVSFLCGDMFHVTLPKVNIIYLFGSDLPDEKIYRLVECLKTCALQTQILSVSYPLTDYDQENIFYLKEQFPLFFPWGKTEAYLQVKQ